MKLEEVFGGSTIRGQAKLALFSIFFSIVGLFIFLFRGYYSQEYAIMNLGLNIIIFAIIVVVWANNETRYLQLSNQIKEAKE